MTLFGWETIFNGQKDILQTPADVLVLFTHWKLLKEGFLCVGNGESNSGSGSEVLPPGWNSDSSVYQLTYQDSSKNKYILKVLLSGDNVIINLLRCCDNKTTDVTINIQEHIGENIKQFESVLINSSQLLETIQHLLAFQNDAPSQSAKPETESQLQQRRPVGYERSRDDDDPLRVGRPHRPQQPGPSSSDWGRPGAPPIGHSDLDPLGRMGGGGMLMDPPFSGGGNPMRPRWDPVGPLDPFDDGFGGHHPLGGGRGGSGQRGRGGGRGGRRGRGGRDDDYGDEMRPPGWNNEFHDNMFM